MNPYENPYHSDYPIALGGMGDQASYSRTLNLAAAFGVGFVGGSILNVNPWKAAIISTVASALGGILERQTLHDVVRPNWAKK